MSEKVQRRMETMTEEFEEMTQTKLFTSEEMRKVMKKRREFEYKVNGNNKDLQDFKEYIKHEKRIIGEIRSRRIKLRISNEKGGLERKIIKRVKVLYEMALQYFNNDVTLSRSYFTFCKQANFSTTASLIMTTMLKNHPDNAEVWQDAVNWHAYDRKDKDTALKTLFKGLELHKNNELLYTKLIQLEIYFTFGKNWSMKKHSSDEDIEKQKLCSRKLKEYISDIFKNIKNCNYYIDLLEYLETYHFTEDIQKVIVDHLLQNYSDQAIMWHTLAQREYRGLHYEVQSDTKLTPKYRLTRCFGRYEDGITKVPATNKSALWSLYLEFLNELQHDNFGVAVMFKSNAFKAALQRASAEGYLSEKYYMVWLEHVDDVDGLRILEEGTAAIPQSVELWKARLRYQIIKDDVSQVDQVFKQGVLALKEKALPLWTAVIRYHFLTSSDDKIELIYKDGVKQPQEISDTLKPQYVEWLALTKGIKEAHKVYGILALEKPFCKELHKIMSKLESAEIETDLKRWVQVHKLACEQFGKENPDVWIDYITFHLDYNRRVDNLMELVQKVHKEACSSLPATLKNDFIDKYNSVREAV